MVTLEQLQAERMVPSHFSDHNAALKVLRYEGELSGNDHVPLAWDLSSYHEIPEVIKAKKTEKSKTDEIRRLATKHVFSGVRDS